MKMSLLIFCAFGLLALVSCIGNNEWKKLFNGMDLEGWEIKGASESNFFV